MSLVKYSNLALTSAIQTLYLDAETADINFIFKLNNGHFESIPAHKSLLIATSKVFRTMFNKAWNKKDCVQIVDATSAAFKDFLQFFYFEEVSVTMKTVAAVMSLGQKYDVDECVGACSSFLSDNLTIENACRVYGLAVLFNQYELQKLSEMMIGINTSAVLKTDDFLKCDKKILTRILKLETLTCDEKDLFQAVMVWIKTKTKLDYLNSDTVWANLGESFFDIRFEMLTMEDFMSIFSLYETLFKAEKRRNIIQTIASKEFDSKSGQINSGRKHAWFKLPFIDCERECTTSSKPYDIHDTEVEIFSTNKPLLLRGIICGEIFCFEDCFNPIMENVPGQIKIFEYCGTVDDDHEELRVIYEDDDIELECDENEYNLWLNKPIIIKPGKMYQIRLILELDDEFCTNIKMTESRAYSNGIFVIFHTERNRGLISGLRFNLY